MHSVSRVFQENVVRNQNAQIFFLQIYSNSPQGLEEQEGQSLPVSNSLLVAPSPTTLSMGSCNRNVSTCPFFLHFSALNMPKFCGETGNISNLESSNIFFCKNAKPMFFSHSSWHKLYMTNKKTWIKFCTSSGHIANGCIGIAKSWGNFLARDRYALERARRARTNCFRTARIMQHRQHHSLLLFATITWGGSTNLKKNTKTMKREQPWCIERIFLSWWFQSLL